MRTSRSLLHPKTSAWWPCRLRLRLLAAGVVVTVAVATGVVSAPAAGAAATTSHHQYELSVKPPAIPKTDLLCDFDHPSWCAGANINGATGADIELAAAAITLVGVVVQVIRGAIYVWFKWLRRYKGKHEGKLVGTCLTQSAGKVIWGKCGTGTTGAVATLRLWLYVPTAPLVMFVNDYWKNRGKTLYLTEPSKIKANGQLRLHALFPGEAGQELQSWKFEAKPGGKGAASVCEQVT